MERKPTYHELFQENTALHQEIARLKQLLQNVNLAVESIQAPDAAADILAQTTSQDNAQLYIHKRSSPEDKINLFMQLFAGRSDVYAKRFVSKRTEKAGYAPVCGNEWTHGICEKPKIKCSKCAHRALMPLTPAVLYRHLSGQDLLGEDVVGVYPMLPDETCRFLVADFDDANWKEDISVFRKICERYGLVVAVERSRSGSGAHVWFFFEEPISCALARRLGSSLLTAAMEQRHDLSFASYDRLLPNQDTMPSGGFGNLIALPLQGLARKSGNSVFVDKDFIPYPDQWAFLSSLQKIPASAVEKLIQQFGRQGELGVLADAEPTSKPWERSPVPMPLTVQDFPSIIKLVKANGIFIAKAGCTEHALSRMRRLAAFKNPDFYKAQAMRLPTFQKPRIICTAWETDTYLCLPRGLEDELLKLLQSADVTTDIQIETECGRTIKADFLGELREEQMAAASALLAHRNGVLSATTAFGKTVTAAYLIAHCKVNTLILVHTQALMNQWKASLEQFLHIDEQLPEQPKGKGRKKQLSLIGQLGGGKNHLNGIIDIAIIGSLVSDGDVKPLVRNYGMVIVDECHHVPALRFESVLREVSARFVYGLTATPIRQDGHQPIIFQQCGPIRYRVDAKEQSLKRGFSHTLIPRFTRFRKPLTAPELWRISEVYATLTESKMRNDFILHDIAEAIQNQRTPLILTERVDHARFLEASLRNTFSDAQIFFLSGKGTAKEKQARLEELRLAVPDKPLAIVATGKYVGEGFDIPRLDTLFITMPVAWKGTVTQYAGRLHRVYEGKQEVVVYDYVDIHVPVLENMYHKRLSAYSSLGYSIQAIPANPDEKIGMIFNQQSFLSVFSHDVIHAMKEIMIVSPYLSKGRINQMKPLFLAAMANGAGVVVITRPPESFADTSRQRVSELIKSLQTSAVKVILRERIHQKFAIVDRSVVWYGSINLLSYGKSEESIMRFENIQIAEELLADVEKGVLE